jgi:hypothetical protein
MLLIFGLRTKVQMLGLVWMACRVCRQPGHQQLTHEVTKLSLFFIPLVPVRRQHVVHCTNPVCGARVKVSPAEARRLLAAGVESPL